MTESNTPLTIHNALFVLKLDNGRYYIGITHNINERLAEHFEKGLVCSLEKVIYPADEVILENITEEYINLYGAHKIRSELIDTIEFDH